MYNLNFSLLVFCVKVFIAFVLFIICSSVVIVIVIVVVVNYIFGGDNE
jgi:hypothetical protein